MSAAAVLMLSLFAAQCHAPGYTQAFDKHFRVAVMYYWPPEQQDWCWLKAQGIAESSLVTTAVSPVGAQGVMQIMPTTLADLQRQAQVDGNVFEARYNIIMGARYMAQSMDFWIFDRTQECRRTMGQAGYNAGNGNILKAQELSGGERCWDGIAPYLYLVTGHYSRETIQYVWRIAMIRRKMQ